jgi:phosphatidylinositol alpha-1,6-mannosyltransferase
MTKKEKILILTLHTFSLTGGIEKVCRCLGKIFSDLQDESKLPFKLFSLHDRRSDLDKKYVKQGNFRGFNGSAIAFGISSLFIGIRSSQVILSHVNLLLFAKLIKLISPQTKIIMFAHGIEVWGSLAAWKKSFLQLHVEIWAVSAFTAKKLVDIHQLDVKKIKIINNCLDPFFEFPTNLDKPLSLLRKQNLTNNQPILFTLTRLSFQESYKGYDQVLRVMPNLIKKFPTMHYIVAGKADDLERTRIENLIHQLGISNHVTMVGFIKNEEVTNYFCLSDVFVMPSTMEGFGIVFIEAAACGVPIIGGNKDGSIDALLNGELGALVDPEDLDSLSKAIEKSLLSKHNKNSIQQIAKTNFSFQQYTEKIKRALNF